MHFRSITSVLAVGLLVAACGDGSQKAVSSREGNDDYLSAGNSPLKGAIFTTDRNGERVKGNIFERKEDVYLDGGPTKHDAGLADGEYYFLVVDPQCTVELAGPSARKPYNTKHKKIEVVDGAFTDLMRLAPFADIHNEGDEFKVLITPVEKYDEDYDKKGKHYHEFGTLSGDSPGRERNGPQHGDDEHDGASCFGFNLRHSKFDTFKIRGHKPPEPPQTYCISGYKWYDADRDGVVDSGEVPVAGIEIELHIARGPVAPAFAPGNTKRSTLTDATGNWEFCGLRPGDYVIEEDLPAPGPLGTWETIFPEGGKHEVELKHGDLDGLGFGNVCYLADVLQAEPCELPAQMELD